MFSFIWDICLSMPMLIAGLADAGLSCADTIGADRAPATTAETSIAVFILVFPLGLNKFMFPLLASTGRLAAGEVMCYHGAGDKKIVVPTLYLRKVAIRLT